MESILQHCHSREVGVSLVLSKLRQRHFNPISIGSHYLKIHMILLLHMMRIKGVEISQERTKCA